MGGGTRKLKWGGTAPPLCGGGAPRKKPAAGANFLQKSGEAVGGHPENPKWGALFKKVQKWGGTFSSASPLPGLKYTPGDV